VHPEAYPVVERILADIKKGVKDIIGDSRSVKALKPEKYTDERFGLPTVQDILRELEKPGRDPRPEFKAATFREGVEDLKDLEPGMQLEGVITNVTNFGAFVDIGVHQDGLVHISALSNAFVKDPHAVVKAGDVVKVKVLEVDIPRKRIALTMRLTDEVQKTTKVGAASSGRFRPYGLPAGGTAIPHEQRRHTQQQRTPEPASGAMAAAFAKLRH
jgi:uncharacterized protein